MAGVIVDMSTGLLCNVLGPDWAPREIRSPDNSASISERKLLADATAAYLRAKQFSDLPPGLMLTVVVLAYATPRFAAPTTRSRIGWLWGKVTGLFRRKRPDAGEPQPLEFKS